jgi:hypothetical protein
MSVVVAAVWKETATREIQFCDGAVRVASRARSVELLD